MTIEKSPVTYSDNPLESVDSIAIDPMEQRILDYLDGELSVEESTAFETELSNTPELRQRFERLQKSWDMLGMLDSFDFDPRLTHSTIEMVSDYTNKETKMAIRRQNRFRLTRYFILFLLAMVAIWAGYESFSRFSPVSDARIQADRPMLERFEALTAIDNFSLLVKLTESHLFDQPIPTRMLHPFIQRIRSVPPQNEANQPSNLANSNTRSTPSDKDMDFFRQAGRFYRQSRYQQNKIRSLWKTITNSPDHEKYLNVMDHYYDWYRYCLHETQRDLIRSKPIDAKMTLIQSFYQSNRTAPEPVSFSDIRPVSDNRSPRDSNVFRRISDILPEELRNEDMTEIRKRFNEYRQNRPEDKAVSPKKDSAESKPGMKGQGRPQERSQERSQERRGGFRLINEFLAGQNPDVLILFLSPRAQDFMKSFSEKDKRRYLGLMLTISFQEDRNMTGSPYNKEPLGSNTNSRKKQEEKNFDPARKGFFPPGMVKRFPNDLSFPLGVGHGPDSMNESTRELAETFRKLPQSTRDELLSLPANEMYARLLAIHWGFK